MCCACAMRHGKNASVLSNRFQLVERERISGHVGGIDFGYNLSCIARSPSVALFWSGGTAYWSGRGSTSYGKSCLTVYRRSGRFTHGSDYTVLGEYGGRLTAKRVLASATEIGKAFDDEDIAPVIADAIRQKKTLVIEGGGQPFWARK
jgi:hypothetical protein